MPPFLLPFIGPVIDKLVGLIPDKQAAEKARLEAQVQLEAQHDEIVKAFLASDQAQDAINAEEAKSTNWFIAGARPFLLWVCAASFAWSFVLEPILDFFLVTFNHPLVLPKLDMSEMMPVLLGMLGLSGMRTYEKLNNVQNNH